MSPTLLRAPNGLWGASPNRESVPILDRPQFSKLRAPGKVDPKTATVSTST
jgi:hypothetical protein